MVICAVGVEVEGFDGDGGVGEEDVSDSLGQIHKHMVGSGVARFAIGK